MVGFTRRKRSDARNIVDCKWVSKWKNELVPDGTTRRIIRARLTIRGLKDLDKAELIRYAGTSQRYSQRLLVSEAANRGWPIASTDISKAFLQGVTYEELAKMTGEPLRDVSFYLPPTSVAMLKQLPGFEDFNPAREVLWCVKPGRETCNLMPTKTDAELLTFHRDGNLMAILAIHVDDLKLIGEKSIIMEIVGHLQRTFGELIVQWHTFTNCGIRHIQDPETMEISLDQFEYIAALKQLPSSSAPAGAAGLDTVVELDVFELFRSSRGAVAYTLLTRADVSVYVVYLQRLSEKNTTWRHIKMLNTVIKRLQTHLVKLTYRKLGPETYFLCFLMPLSRRRKPLDVH